jgi:pyridoxal phosphate enzyme (YggS family)
MSTIAENLADIRSRMEASCLRSGRDSGGVRLVGVTKTVLVERIQEGVAAGITILGENYIQEAARKIEALSDLRITWHFIGHLQSNKAKVAADCCDWVETVDRESLAKELDRHVLKRGRKMPVLIQVNVGDEASKSGVSPEGLPQLFRAISQYEGLEVRGLMTLPPYFENPEEVRPYFQMLRRLLGELRQEASRPELLTELSMGMSHDFEVAIEEGATLIRVGTALFGSRAASRT